MEADRSRSAYDPKISPPGAGARVAYPPGSQPFDSASAFAGSAAPSEGGNGQSSHSPKDAFRNVTALIAEMKEYLAYYVSAKLDGVKLSFRNLGIYATLGIVGLIAGSAFITTAAVLLLAGAALGLGRLFSPAGDPYKFLWLVALTVGIIFFLTVGLGTVFGLRKLTHTSKKATVQKYEQRQNWERGQFGHNVAERATQSTNK